MMWFRITIVLSILGLSQIGTAQTWVELAARADSLCTLGQYADAETSLHAAIALNETQNGAVDSILVRLMDNLGKGYYRLADYPNAERVWWKTLEMRENISGQTSMEAAKVLNNLAVLHKAWGNYSESEALFRKNLDIRERLLGPDHPDIATCLNNLANLLLSQARYAEAEADYQRALDIMQRSRGEDDSLVAVNLNNIAALYHVQGRYSDAEPLYQKALEVMIRVYGPMHPSVAQAYNNLGYLYHDMRQYDKAEPLYQQALTIEDTTLGQGHPKVAATLSNLARLYTDEAKLDLAELYVRRALIIGETTQGPDHPDVAEMLKNLGDVLQLQGRNVDADLAYQRALAILEKAVGKVHPVEAGTLFGLAMLAKQNGDFAKAKKYESRAYNIRRRNFSEGFAVLAERNALEYSRFLQEEASNYISILLDSPDGAKANRTEIARVVLSIKGLVSDGVFNRHKAVSAIAGLVDSLNQSRQILSELYVRGPDPSRAWSYNADMQRATQRKERFEADLARQSGALRNEQMMTDVDVSRVAERLPAGCAVIDYLRYDHRLSIRETESRYLAVLIKHGGKIAIVPLGTSAEIDSAVSRYRRHFQNPTQFDLVRAEYSAASADVSQLAWNPVSPQLADVSTIFFAPDGALSLVSFAGLLDESGGFLIEQFAVHYLLSGRDLLQTTSTVSRGTGLLALGDPDYDAAPASRTGGGSKGMLAGIQGTLMSMATRNITSNCRALRDIQVKRLPGTRPEVEKLAARWTEIRNEPAIILLDNKASEENLKRNCRGTRAIHLATHGYYISEECQPNPLGVGYIGESPLLQSGLFLAGANLKGQGSARADADDGIVTAEEVASLNLQGTQLVILSACETAVGAVHSGEGVFGLRRAFQMAGARTVISALWPLDDESASVIIGQLFDDDSESIADAIRNSTLQRIAELRAAGRSDDPFYWAALIATGDWKAR